MTNVDFPEDLAIRVRNVEKTYRLGVINRHTLRDELLHSWLRLRGLDPKGQMGRIGGREQAASGLFHALDGVSFDIRRGETVGLIGRNGAGKSTMLKILARITTPSSGEAWIRGRVGSMLEVGTGFHPELTGRENIYLNGTIIGMTEKEIDEKFDEIVAFSEIGEFLDTPVKRYSSGMYVKLAFSIASSLDNDVLLLDEVLAVGDAAFRKKSLARMKQIASSGRTILFVSHSMGDVKAICSRCIWFDHGRLHMDGPSVEVADEYIKPVLSPEREIFTSICQHSFESKSEKNEIDLDGLSVFRNQEKGNWGIVLQYHTSLVHYRDRPPTSEWGWPRVILSVRSTMSGGRLLFVLDSDCVKVGLPIWLPPTGTVTVELDSAIQLPPGGYSIDVRLLQGRRLMLERAPAASFVIPDSFVPPFWHRRPFRPGLADAAHTWHTSARGPSLNGKKTNG